MSKLIIGLTGGIGSGKTTVADLFLKYNIDIIDADIVARDMVEPGTQALTKIAEKFGAEFILADGNLDRAKLRHRIFATPSDKQWLNDLLHPLIRDEMQHRCATANSPYCLLVAPLLIENGIYNTVDKVLVVDVTPKTQLLRTTARDNNTEQQVQKILDAQIPREERLKHADFIVHNEQSSLFELEQQVEALHRTFLKMLLISDI